MAELIPRLMALESGRKYLRYVLEEGELHSRMQVISDEVVGERSFTKLEIVSAETSFEEDSLIHIRSAYNNKFLVLSNQVQNWIVAGADEPEEDRSKWSCTLFRVSVTQNRLRLFLQSAGAEHGVQVSEVEKCLTIVRNSTTAVQFGMTDLDSLAILPKHISFKGNNGKYLKSSRIRLRNRLKFDSSNISNRTAHHQSFMLPNGDVRLRSDHFGRFWRKSGPMWIWCDSTDPSGNNRDTVYRPVRLDTEGNTIALLNRGNNKYCTRHTKAGQPRLKNTLIASASRVESNAVLVVEEAVRSREIYDVQYRVEDARIYDVGLVSNVSQSTNNFSPTSTATKQLGFTYTKMTQETFSSSHSWKIKLSVTVKAKIPVFAQGTIKMDTSYEGSVSWSELKETTEEISSFLNVEVPPMTKVIVNMLVGRGSIDIPFSYTQRDILLDGRIDTDRLHDGLFTGVNTEMIDYTIKEESISDEEARVAVSSKL